MYRKATLVWHLVQILNVYNTVWLSLGFITGKRERGQRWNENPQNLISTNKKSGNSAYLCWWPFFCRRDQRCTDSADGAVWKLARGTPPFAFPREALFQLRYRGKCGKFVLFCFSLESWLPMLWLCTEVWNGSAGVCLYLPTKASTAL